MEQARMIFASKTVALAETKTYLELTNRVLFYDAPNLNGDFIPSEGALEKAETLVGMPVVAKYRKNVFGQPDLGGHECFKDPATEEVCFGTENVGTHISVEIKDDEVKVGGKTVTLPCLFATSRIWTRNKNVVAAIKRLYAEGRLFNSWEMISSSYTFQDGIRTMGEYVFEANCLLGSGHRPAGGDSAAAVGMAEINDTELMVAEAMEADLKDEREKEVTMSEKNMTEPVVEPVTESIADQEANTVQAQAEDQGGGGEVQTASLTEWDLRKKIQEACRAKLDKWCWIAYHFPVERVVWVETEGRASELDYVMLTYTVGENDEITLSEPTNVTLTVAVKDINSVVAAKDDALVKANEKINQLSAEVTSLKPYKEAAQQAEQERIEAETKEKRAAFAEQMRKTNLFTAEELEGDPAIMAMIENLDDTAMKREIAERFMRSLDQGADTDTHLIAETTPQKEQVNLHAEPEETTDEFMRPFLGR